MLLVLDTSVIVKWFAEEEHTANALRIREQLLEGAHEAIVPDLLLYELANHLRYDRRFSEDLVAQVFRSLFEIQLTVTVPSQELFLDAVRLARQRNITVYDAIYVALALAVNGTLVTADRKLRAAAPDQAVRDLSEF